jgi:hypothetical protein
MNDAFSRLATIFTHIITMDSTEHQRMRNIKNCKLYYERHADEVLKRKALNGMARGSIPRAKTCEVLKISVVELMRAWSEYMKNNTPSESREEKFKALMSRYALS